LLPVRKGKLACFECRQEFPDIWDVTINLSQGDFDACAQYAKQLKRLRDVHRRCQHSHVLIAVHPWCSDCGEILDHDHPMAQIALRRIDDMHTSTTGPMADTIAKFAYLAQRIDEPHKS